MERQSNDSQSHKITERLLTNEDPLLGYLCLPLFQELHEYGYQFKLMISATAGAWQLDRDGDFVNTKLYIIKAILGELNHEQLTHELLHVWLDHKGFAHYLEIQKALNSDAKNTINDYIFPVAFNTSMAENQRFIDFNNRLAHVKMLDQFIALGFDKANFLFTKPDFEKLKQSYMSKINLWNTSKGYCVLLDYWSLRLINKMETLTDEEVETLDGLLRERSLEWYNFAQKMYESWQKDFCAIDNLGFYKKLVYEYSRLNQKNILEKE